MKSRPVPILVGTAQFTQSKDALPSLDPLGLMIRASRDAFADTGSYALPALIDTVCVVNSFSRDDENTPKLLARSLGIKPRDTIYSLIGGNTPQKLVNQFSSDIAAGRRRAVLISGAEAIYSLHRQLKRKEALDWSDNLTFRQLREKNLKSNFDSLLHLGCEHEKSIVEAQCGKYDNPNNRIEEAYNLFMPQYMYPFFETALRNLSGRTPEEHRLYLGRCYERLSRIASQNPYAWYRRVLSTENITLARPRNPFIAYPYTLRLVANINVDQSAALILTSDQDAQALGINRSCWVYPMGGAELNNIWHVTNRPHFHDSPAITEASRLALKQAGLSLHDIDVFDLYSCFPSALEISRRAIGIPEEDPRDLSVTGGLAYFGGPGNNYAMHAIAAVVDRIRHNNRLKAMVTANGWYNSKHAIGIYGAEPPDSPWEDHDFSAIQKAIIKKALPDPIEKASGILMVEAFLIRYDTEGRPERATVVGRLQDGNRALADVRADTVDLRKFEDIELVGKMGEVSYEATLRRNVINLFPLSRL